MVSPSDIVLILGSGPRAPVAAGWPRAWFDRIVTINNAWNIRPDWDDLIFPEDFPRDRRPVTPAPGQRLIGADQFVPAQNKSGGFVFAGGTMAFTAGYWALEALRPKVMAWLGCDMVYPASGPTHFYGTGTADPLRADVTLQDLGAKSARLALIAATRGCHCVNLSEEPSKLLFARLKPENLRAAGIRPVATGAVSDIIAAENALSYGVPSGRYWEESHRFDAQALARIDAQWRTTWESLPHSAGYAA
ncbi:hypothetical protein [Roseobacter sp.]|uniref:hypothetical protein n=1 Tax=Roseobacter sp. TaxID=1907202 RepID=UPI0025DE9F2D|nr:hypothetical protein [Roseobacter sp.]